MYFSSYTELLRNFSCLLVTNCSWKMNKELDSVAVSKLSKIYFMKCVVLCKLASRQYDNNYALKAK